MGQVTHALLTRPPLSLQPSIRKLPSSSSVRLACVRHAASVHPEPGSNSHVLMFSRFQDQLLANLSSVRQFLLPSLLFCLGLFRLVISNLTLKFFLGIFRVALLFICQGTVFSSPSGLFHRSALWQFLAFPAKCFAIISQAFLFVKYFFLISSTSFSAPGFPFAAEFYQHTPAPFACPCSGCTPIQVDFLQSVRYQCCVCPPQRMLSYHRWLSPSSTFFIFLHLIFTDIFYFLSFNSKRQRRALTAQLSHVYKMYVRSAYPGQPLSI